MKRVILGLLILTGPAFSMAGEKLIAVQDVQIPVGSDTVFVDTAGSCVLKVEAAEYERIISKNAVFDIKNTELLPKSDINAAEYLRLMILQNFSVNIDPEKKKSFEELKNLVETNYGVTLNSSELYSQVLTIESRSSGEMYSLICRTKENHSKKSILAYLYKTGLLKPSKEL